MNIEQTHADLKAVIYSKRPFPIEDILMFAWLEVTPFLVATYLVKWGFTEGVDYVSNGRYRREGYYDSILEGVSLSLIGFCKVAERAGTPRALELREFTIEESLKYLNQPSNVSMSTFTSSALESLFYRSDYQGYPVPFAQAKEWLGLKWEYHLVAPTLKSMGYVKGNDFLVSYYTDAEDFKGKQLGVKKNIVTNTEVDLSLSCFINLARTTSTLEARRVANLLSEKVWSHRIEMLGL